MAVHEFMCPKCGRRVELQRSISEDSAPLCCEEDCGGIPMIQQISLSSFRLRGSGWSSDGYAKPGK